MIALKLRLLIISLCLLGLSACASQVGSPLLLSDELITLSAIDGRKIDVRVLTPTSCTNCPLIIFSHGANASYARYDQYLLPLATQGFRITAANHVDSEEHPNRSDYTQNDSLAKRIEDYEVIAKHFKPDTLIAMGHSYGALIAQMAAGAELADGLKGFKINPLFRPKTVIALSPPGLIAGYTESVGWSKINTPFLVVTGTTDVIPKFADQWQAHLASYEAAPKGSAYALVYKNMNHYMNGAYGRETDDVNSERDRAMAHLLRSSVDFINATTKNDAQKIDWVTQSQEFVQAISN